MRVLRSITAGALADLPLRLAVGLIFAVAATFLFADSRQPDVPVGTRETTTSEAPAPTGTIEPVTTYRVRRGDTLRSIAARFLGDESLWSKIYRANRDQIEPGNLQVGTEILIPAP